MRFSWSLQGGQGNIKLVYVAHLHVSHFQAGGPRLDYVNVPKNIVKYITGNNICMVSALIRTVICTEVNCLFASVSSAVMSCHTHKYDDTVYTVIIFYMQYI